MNHARSREQLEHDHDVAKFHFIAIELDVALTFCEMTFSTNNEDKAERTAEHARQAYGAAKRFLPGARLAPQMKEEIADKLKRLEPLMRRLLQEPG